MLFWLIVSLMILAGLCLAVPSFIKNRRLALCLFILLPLASLVFYMISGRYAAWQQHRFVQEQLAAVRSDIRQFGEPKQLILQLESKVQNTPNDPRAWYFLGKLYLGTKQFSKAHHAFERAKQLAPEEQGIGFLCVQTAFFMHQTLNQKEKDFLKMLLKKQPDHIPALDLLALEAFNQGDYDLAIQYWETILKHLPTEAIKDRKTIQERIRQARKR